MEHTLVIVKPDGVKQGHVGDIIKRFEDKRYSIDKIEVVKATKEQLAKHYSHLVDKPFYHEIEDYMLEGNIVVMVISGNNIIDVAHKMSGSTNPDDALFGTIRGDYARTWEDGIVRNVIHTSDSQESADKEIAIWFK